MSLNPHLVVCAGSIPGLRLPRYAWQVLEREDIRTLDQLRAVAHRIESVFPGIGQKGALLIRAELARIAGRRRSQQSEPLPPAEA